MNPNNMRKALTAEELIRMYDLNNLNKDRKQIRTTKENLQNQNKLINNFVEATIKGLNDLQDQVDGNITTWFFNGVPALDSEPAVDWISDEEKINHLGDLYYDKDTGYAYRFALENNVFSWIKITDSDVTKALAIANSAQDTADSKRRVFVTLPITPYDVGDIWIKEDKELWRCRATRKSGAYSSVDWILATDYTNDDYAKNVEAVLNQFKTKVETDYVTKVQLETTEDSILSSVESTTTKIEHRLQNIEELKDTITGNNELTIKDALEANAIEYKAEGKSEQYEIPTPSNPQEIKSINGVEIDGDRYLKILNNGENLFDVNDTRDVNSNITKTNDDWLTLVYDNSSGTSIKWFNYYTNKSKLLKPNTNYAIFLEIKEVSGNRSISLISNNNDSNKAQFGINKSYQFSDISNNTIYKYIATTRPDFSDCYTMLRTFISIHPGESGSITFRISVIEDIELTVEDFEYKPYEQKEVLIPLKKQNLFDTSIKNTNANLVGTVENNKIHFLGVAKSTWFEFQVPEIPILQLDKVYCVNFVINDATLTGGNLWFDKDAYGTVVNNISATPNKFNFFTLKNDYNLLRGALSGFETGKSYDFTLEIKIYEGTDTKDYYRIDALSDVKDELEIINNKAILHKKFDRRVFDGRENWSLAEQNENSFGVFYITQSFVKKGIALSNYLKYINYIGPVNESKTNLFDINYNQIRIASQNSSMTVAEFKNWLSEHNVEVLYQLAEPYDIELGTIPTPLRQGYNKLTLVEDLETNTSATYLKDNVLNEEFARQLDLDITNDNLNSAKNDISSLNTDVHNSYQDILSKLNNKVDNEMITQITNRVEETVTSTEWAVNRIQDITVNGVSQVQTGNGMTFNDDGLNFDREGAPVGSSVDEAGMKITDKTGASNSILQYTGFVTDEIANEVPELSKSKGSVVNYAESYFFGTYIKGKYGQLEETEDDELGRGWSIFVGGEE